jgi:hypothetical protein
MPDTDFSTWWDRAYAHIESDPYYEQVMGCPDDGWALDCLISHHHDGTSPEQAVDEIVDNYDPTP